MIHTRTPSAITLLLALTLAVVACGPASSSPSPTATAAPTASPSADPPVSASPSASASAAGDALYDEIEQQVAQLRELAPTAPVEREVIDEVRLREMLTAQYDEDSPPEYVAANERLYKALGLLPQDASLRQLSLDLLSGPAGVAGFYDDDEKKMYLVSRTGEIGPSEEITYAHEFTHALQDQHNTVFKDQKDVLDKSDWFLARQAVYEGDASLLMSYWAIQNLTPEELAKATTADPAQQAAIDSMPPILSETLLYPYTTGAFFVQGAQMTGGWPSVDAMYDRMPVSTEQILHPEKYAANEAPVEVELPDDLAATLGDGWTVPLFDTFGELQMGIWLRNTGVEAGAANAAAAGWGGDRLAVVNGPDGAWATVMRTAWDSEADAEEFEAAATTALQQSGGVAQVLPGDGGTTRWVVVGSDDATLSKVAGVLGLAG